MARGLGVVVWIGFMAGACAAADPADPVDAQAPVDIGSETASQADVAPDVAAGSDAIRRPDGGAGPSCDHAGFAGSLGAVTWVAANTVAFAVSQSAAGVSEDRLSLRLRSGGAFTGPTGPGVWPLSGSYETCDACLVISSGCDADGVCQAVFFGTEGTLNIETWDHSAFVVHLDGVVLREVNVSNPSAVTPVPDGATWCLDGVTFEAPTDATTAPDAPADGCLAEGSGVWMGDQVGDVTLTNCLGEAVSLHETCGQGRAMRLMSTTGWCGGCHTALQALAAEHGGLLTREAIRAATPGLDMLVLLAEDEENAPPTQAYCMAYATAYDVDPAMVLMDHDEGGQEVALADPWGTTYVLYSMAHTWSRLNPYLKAKGDVVSAVYPWHALIDSRTMTYYWSEFSGVSDLEGAMSQLLED